jgi:hypothetical protein
VGEPNDQLGVKNINLLFITHFDARCFKFDTKRKICDGVPTAKFLFSVVEFFFWAERKIGLGRRLPENDESWDHKEECLFHINKTSIIPSS